MTLTRNPKDTAGFFRERGFPITIAFGSCSRGNLKYQSPEPKWSSVDFPFRSTFVRIWDEPTTDPKNPIYKWDQRDDFQCVQLEHKVRYADLNDPFGDVPFDSSTGHIVVTYYYPDPLNGDE